MRNTVGARELKTRLGKYIQQVRKGLTIVVTERGEPVAELRPLSPPGDSEEARLERLVVLGFLSRKSAKPPAEFRPIRSRGPALSSVILKDREDRF